MKIAIISTKEESLRKLYYFLSKKNIFTEVKKILIKFNNESSKDAFELLKEKYQLSSNEIFFLADLDNDRELAAEIAVNLEMPCFSSCADIIKENGSIKIKKEVFGGLAHLNLSIRKVPFVMTLSNAILEASDYEESDTPAFESINIVPSTTRCKILSVKKVEKSVNLSSASKIVSIGRGVAKEDDIDMMRDLAVKMKAEIGCSRPLTEDYKWLPLERQVGLTGEIVKPKLYLAVGISGQIQHVVGMRDSKVVVAINNNKNAPIFEYCDYGIIGDLYEVIPILSQKLA